jgi:AdoMet-dependent rRNA methyltransferase SPB1
MHIGNDKNRAMDPMGWSLSCLAFFFFFMGGSKKHAKGRLDKFYHLAKDQGYRARSAFKLIQLNKKFAFLENSKCVIDLCAAPGGWLQVCQKYMPKPNLIIGVDLEKIKPIPGVITHVEDITTASCRNTLKKDLKTWKADVVLHDGAPNVGVSWAQDAFTQSELTLSACKLASEFLVPGGTFVSKVFRSKEYNKLMWVFGQLFDKVEATKPTASRNVSAEIFVVCRGYKAPKKIDPRLLDPKYAFKEMDDIEAQEELDVKKLKQQQGAILNDLMHPEKRKRHRDGYEDGNYTLFKSHPVSEFIQSVDFLGILARSSALEFGKDEFSQSVSNSVFTTEDIKEHLKDLKLLGKKDFKELIKWRDSIRIELGLVKKEAPKAEKEESEEEDMETLLEKERQNQEHKAKKLKKKQRERKAKTVMKMQLGMATPMDIGMEMQGDILEPDFDMGDDDMQIDQPVADAEEDSDYESQDELTEKIQRLDAQVEEFYEEYARRRVERDPTAKVKKQKEASKAFDEWYGIEEEKKMKQLKTEFDSESDSSGSDDSESEVEEERLSKKAKLFFDNSVFEGVQKEDDDLFDEDLERSLFKEDMSDKKSKKGKKQSSLDEEDKGFEVVPATQPLTRSQEDDSDLDDSFNITTPQAYTLAQRMLTKSGKRDVIDEAYNKYAFNDPEGLPSW